MGSDAVEGESGYVVIEWSDVMNHYEVWTFETLTGAKVYKALVPLSRRPRIAKILEDEKEG